MRAALPLLPLLLAGCVFFDEPDLHEDTDDRADDYERVDCFADLPEEAADTLLPGACEIRIDFDANGVTDSRWTFGYDEEGRRTSWRADGSVVRYSYDAAGNLELTERDIEGDGIPDMRERRDYSCFEADAAEGPAPGPCTISTDTGADGTADFEQTLTYEDGLLRDERNELNGRVLSLVHHEYDDEGRRTSTTWDTQGDGTVDSVTRFGYDDEGHALYARSDNLDDGSIEASTEYTLDEDGRPLIVEEFSQERLTSTTRFERDAEGRAIRETTTYPNESEDFVTERRYDHAGNLLAESSSVQPFRAPEQCRRYDYECF